MLTKLSLLGHIAINCGARIVICGLLWTMCLSGLWAQDSSERFNFGLVPSTRHIPSQFGSRAIFDPQGDTLRYNYQGIGTPGWQPRISLAENGDYYVVYDAPSINQLRIYKNTGDPAVDPWTYVISIVYAGEFDWYMEIEACSSVPRIFVFYGLHTALDNQDVEMFWFLMSDPFTNGFVTVVNDVSDCSVTTDEVEYNGVIYLYLAYSQPFQGVNDIILFKRSLDWGFTWQDAAIVAIDENIDFFEDCIAYCPGNNRLLLTYRQSSDNDTWCVARSTQEYGLGDWEITPVAQYPQPEYVCPYGITCSYGSHVFSTGDVWSETSSWFDIAYVYSNDGGDTWSDEYVVEQDGWQSQATCASNRQGYFSIAYHNATHEYRASMLNFWDQLGNINSWTPIALGPLTFPGSASTYSCLEEGDSPRHGAVWADMDIMQCYFGWAEWNLELIVWVSQFFDSWSYFSNPIPADRELVIENAGTVPMSWYASENIDWLTVTPNSGVLGPLQTDTLFCSYVSPWPGVGMHTGTVTITAPGAQGSPQDVLFTLYCSLINTPLTVEMVPHNPPIHVPYGGGSFQFHFVIANPSSSPATFDFWTDIVKPNSAHTPPRLGPFYDRTWGPNYTFTSSEKNQNIPFNAPAGMYSYVGYLGDYPDDVWKVDYFTFVKDGPPVGDVAYASAVQEADGAIQNEPFFMREQDATEFVVGAYPDGPRYLQAACSPNPFNPMTTIRYDLPTASYVTLEIFDISGRQIGQRSGGLGLPFQEWQKAGSHEVIFNGAGLSSGIYLYRLSAGEFVATDKMVLMK